MRLAQLILFVSTLGLAACGTAPEDRAITGASIGAASGAVVGALTGAPGLGAAIGAGIGGVAGALTDKSTLDIGDPIWRKSSNSKGSSGQVSSSQDPDVKAIQSNLSELGYDPGPADGVVGAKTGDAIRDYQEDQGLLVDGRPSDELLNHIEETNAPG